MFEPMALHLRVAESNTLYILNKNHKYYNQYCTLHVVL